MEMLILAGGLGTRLKSVVSDVPKPMAHVGGKPFVEYILEYGHQQGISKFIFLLGYKGTIIQEYFKNEFKDIPIEYCNEDTPLGTGGCILNALSLIKSNHFFIINGDTLFMVNLKNLFESHKKTHSSLTLSLFSSADPRYGKVDLDEQSRIIGFNKNSQSTCVNGGIYCANKLSLESFPWKYPQKVSFEDDIIPFLISTHRYPYGYTEDKPFIDIGIPSDYQRAEQFIKSNFYQV